LPAETEAYVIKKRKEAKTEWKPNEEQVPKAAPAPPATGENDKKK